MPSFINRVDSHSTLVSSNASTTISTVWTKPATIGYKLSGLLSFPKRVISPPPAGLPMLASVGSLNLRPSYEVKIDDMLAGKYLPPLGLRDFEEWLLFTEHSEENLYFLQWMKEYTLHFEDGSWTDMQLWFSFLRAKASFFVPNGSHELNLPSTVVREIAAISMSNSDSSSLTDNEHKIEGTSASRPPSPAHLAAAQEHVRRMLSNSLTKFASDATSNAGILRRFYCGSAGLAAIGVGMLPVLLSILRGYTRFIRLLAFPCFWLGCIIILCAYAKVCLVIYFWGDFRQLRGYELDMPSINTIARLLPDAKPGKATNGVTAYPPPLSTASTIKSQYSPRTPTTAVDPGFLQATMFSQRDVKDGAPSEGDADTEYGEDVVFQKDDIEARDSSTPPFVLKLPTRLAAPLPSTPDNERVDSTSVPTHPLRRRAPAIPSTLPRSPASALGFDWDAVPPPIYLEKQASSRPSSIAASRKSHRSFTSFLFARTNTATPISLGEMSEKITPIFAPLTKVINPLIVRGMAEIVRRSTFWGAVFGLLLTALTFVVPFKDASWGYGW